MWCVNQSAHCQRNDKNKPLEKKKRKTHNDLIQINSEWCPHTKAEEEGECRHCNENRWYIIFPEYLSPVFTYSNNTEINSI